MANINACFSHKSDEWSTPQDFFDDINKEFNFNLDVCANDDNHKCDKFFTIEDNGLEKNWGGTECSVIHHIARLTSGLQRHFTKQGMTIH